MRYGSSFTSILYLIMFSGQNLFPGFFFHHRSRDLSHPVSQSILTLVYIWQLEARCNSMDSGLIALRSGHRGMQVGTVWKITCFSLPSSVHEQSSRPSTDRQPAKYKHDENVLDSGPIVYKQIEVRGEQAEQHYVTDAGMVVPAVSYLTRCKLFAAAESFGLSKERQLEMVGRSASEMVMQLVGGVNRWLIMAFFRFCPRISMALSNLDVHKCQYTGAFINNLRINVSLITYIICYFLQI